VIGVLRAFGHFDSFHIGIHMTAAHRNIYYSRRNKSGTNKLFPEYHVYMMDGDRFLMCSKKRPNNKTSNYLISMKAGDLSRGGRNYLGKLRANFVGTEFQVNVQNLIYGYCMCDM
jgi:Tub family